MKKVLLYALLLVRRILGFVSFQEISVLAYHSVGDVPVDTAVSREAFARHLKHLCERGYSFVTLQEIVGWCTGKNTLSRKAVALTFDDGYTDFETTVLPLLKEFKAPATLFVVGDERESRVRLGNDIPLLDDAALLRLRAHPLVTIGYHSRTHQNLSSLSPDALRRECESPFPADFFAYPGGSHSLESRTLLRELGYKGAFSLKPTLVKRASDVYVMPRNIMLRNMPLWQLDARTTKAIDWYRAVRKFLKPYRPL